MSRFGINTIIFSAAILLSGCSGKSQPNTQTGTGDVIPKNTSVPESLVRVDCNIVETGSGGSDIRFIVASMDGKYFKQEELANLFHGLSREYGESSLLRIDLFSDAEMARRWSKYIQDPPPGDRLPGRDSTKWARDNLPLPSGYYRASYTRDATADYFYYSPDPDKEDEVRVEISKAR